jgi:hypothetical protein
MAGNKMTPFISLHHRSAEFSQAYRAGVKACLSWLEEAAWEHELHGHPRHGRHRAKALRRAAQELSDEAHAVSFIDDWDQEGDEPIGAMAHAFMRAIGED